MNGGAAGVETIYLKPGELAFLARPSIVTTVLGSCVAVVMHCPARIVGAICHAVFPDSNGEADLRFVDQAIAHMLSAFDRQAIPHDEIVVKLFGGADMYCSGENCVGSKNVAAATTAIGQIGMRIVAKDVGGDRGRKLIFHSNTGEVMVRRFHASRGCP